MSGLLKCFPHCGRGYQAAPAMFTFVDGCVPTHAGPHQRSPPSRDDLLMDCACLTKSEPGVL